MNFKLKEVKNYDEHHAYGTDWVTEYICYSDTNMEIDDTINELKKLGHEPCGELKQIYDEKNNELRLITKMY